MMGADVMAWDQQAISEGGDKVERERERERKEREEKERD